MTWDFDNALKSQINIILRSTMFRKPIAALRSELRPDEFGTIEELMVGFGWGADEHMQRLRETDCLAILVATPHRLLIGAGVLTSDMRYDDLARCYWAEEDLCVVTKDQLPGVGGIRFQPTSRDWTESRRTNFLRLIESHMSYVDSGPSASAEGVEAWPSPPPNNPMQEITELLNKLDREEPPNSEDVHRLDELAERHNVEFNIVFRKFMREGRARDADGWNRRWGPG